MSRSPEGRVVTRSVAACYTADRYQQESCVDRECGNRQAQDYMAPGAILDLSARSPLSKLLCSVALRVCLHKLEINIPRGQVIISAQTQNAIAAQYLYVQHL